MSRVQFRRVTPSVAEHRHGSSIHLDRAPAWA